MSSPDLPVIDEATRILVMRQLAAKGGRKTGKAKKRPAAHYKRLARINRDNAKKRKEQRGG